LALIGATDGQGINTRANEEDIASTSGGLGEDRFPRFRRLDELTLPPVISERVAPESVAEGELGQSVPHGSGEIVQSSPLPQRDPPLEEPEATVMEVGSGEAGSAQTHLSKLKKGEIVCPLDPLECSTHF